MIIIKTKMKEMPSTCEECPFSYRSDHMGFVISCTLTYEYAKSIEAPNGIKIEKIPDSCPLREI